MRKIAALSLIILVFLMACSRSQKDIQGYIEGYNLYLASPYPGILEKLLVQKGQFVKKGKVLFILDDLPQSLVIEQARASLVAAKMTLSDIEKPRRTPEIEAIKSQIERVNAQLNLASIRVSRLQTLFKKNAVDKDSLDAAVALQDQQQKLKNQYESNLKLAYLGSREEQIKAQQAEVSGQEAKLKQALWELQQKTVVAPVDGVIYDNFYRAGEYVQGAQPVLALLSANNVEVNFFVPLALIKDLKLGQKISFRAEDSSKAYPAVIDYISPEAEYIPPLIYSRDNADKLVFKIQAHFEAFGEFKPGQPVLVTLP